MAYLYVVQKVGTRGHIATDMFIRAVFAHGAEILVLASWLIFLNFRIIITHIDYQTVHFLQEIRTPMQIK
jgi:TRAP-type C4-dicarboxylate transport system permease small subunit